MPDEWLTGRYTPTAVKPNSTVQELIEVKTLVNCFLPFPDAGVEIHCQDDSFHDYSATTRCDCYHAGFQKLRTKSMIV